MKKPSGHIRFGVICGSTLLSAWHEIVIKKLISEPDIEMKLLVLERDVPVKQGANFLFHSSLSKANILWNLFYLLRIKKKSNALHGVETKFLFEDVPKIQCDFINRNDGSQELEDSDIEKIENAALDFILDFSSMTLTGKMLRATRYGIWSYQFGNPEKFIGSPSCFWEIYYQDVLTSAYLTRLTDEPVTMIVLKEGHLKTDISHSKNIDRIHFECTAWPLMICQDIRNNSTESLNVTSKIELGKTILPPGNVELLVFLLVQIKLLVKRGFKLLFYTDYWNIGIAFAPIHEFLNTEKIPSIEWFPNLSKSRFIADPFGVYYKDELYVLYEDLLFDQGIGKTASFLFKNGSFTENRIVIDEEFHMSYPFLLEDENQIYCIPETYQANQVRLYKAVEFPNKWKLEKVLIENYAGIDNTPFKQGSTWFLFSTNKNSGPHYNLNIHYSDSIFGPWQEHAKNPVKTDIRSARPAGTIFEHDGNIFRPSMDYSEKIEGRIIINKIITLTKDDFKEEVHNSVDPFENTYFADKVHTLSKVGSYTLVDGAKELFIFSNFNAFKYKIKRVWAKLIKK